MVDSLSTRLFNFGSLVVQENRARSLGVGFFFGKGVLYR